METRPYVSGPTQCKCGSRAGCPSSSSQGLGVIQRNTTSYSLVLCLLPRALRTLWAESSSQRHCGQCPDKWTGTQLSGTASPSGFWTRLQPRTWDTLMAQPQTSLPLAIWGRKEDPLLETFYKNLHRSTWVAQSVGHLTLGFGLGHDFRVMLEISFSPSAPLHSTHALSHSLSLTNK